jgi:hypothetical protein
MRAWIDRTNDGLSGMPADGISLPQTKGNFGTSRWAARKLGYITFVTRRKRSRPFTHKADVADMPTTLGDVCFWGKADVRKCGRHVR